MKLATGAEPPDCFDDAGYEVVRPLVEAFDLAEADGVATVEATLVSVAGRVVFPSGPLQLRGTLACQKLDLSALLTPSERILTYAQDMDPRNPPTSPSPYRIYYGEPEDGARVAVTGAGGGGV